MSQKDDFEFKPITEGLGFHKKVVNLQTEVEKVNLFKKGRAPTIPVKRPDETAEPKFDRLFKSTFQEEIIEDGTKDTGLIHTPLPRDRGTQEIEIPRFKTAPYYTMPSFAREENTEEKQLTNIIPEAPALSGTKEAPIHFGAVLFDAVVVSGLTCLFSVGLMLGAEVDVIKVLLTAQYDWAARIGFAVLLFSIIELYVVMTRSLFGATIGEWAFDMQVGNKKIQSSAWYPLLVTWRSLVVAITGFVLLPLISLAIQKDVTGKITGLTLTREY